MRHRVSRPMAVCQPVPFPPVRVPGCLLRVACSAPPHTVVVIVGMGRTDDTVGKPARAESGGIVPMVMRSLEYIRDTMLLPSECAR